MFEADRISYSFGMKVNLGNYESADFHISMSSTVKNGETPEEAMARLQKFVEDEADKKREQIKG